MFRYPNVLLFAAEEEETDILQRILDEHAVVTAVHNQSDLASVLEGDVYDALFWSWSFHSGTWSEALRKVHEVSPDLPVIILSNAPEERAWLRALNAGAFDLLVAPFEPLQLIAVLEQATASREARTSRRVLAGAHGRV